MIHGGHAPHSLRNGNWAQEKDKLVKTVFATLDGFAPGWSDGVIDYQALTPRDIEAVIGSPQGHIFHGEITVDQLFWKRPVPQSTTSCTRRRLSIPVCW